MKHACAENQIGHATNERFSRISSTAYIRATYVEMYEIRKTGLPPSQDELNFIITDDFSPDAPTMDAVLRHV